MNAESSLTILVEIALDFNICSVTLSHFFFKKKIGRATRAHLLWIWQSAPHTPTNPNEAKSCQIE